MSTANSPPIAYSKYAKRRHPSIINSKLGLDAVSHTYYTNHSKEHTVLYIILLLPGICPGCCIGSMYIIMDIFCI